MATNMYDKIKQSYDYYHPALFQITETINIFNTYSSCSIPNKRNNKYLQYIFYF